MRRALILLALLLWAAPTFAVSPGSTGCVTVANGVTDIDTTGSCSSGEVVITNATQTLTNKAIDGGDAGTGTTYPTGGNKVGELTHDTDCTSITGVPRRVTCTDENDWDRWICLAADGTCDAPSDWKASNRVLGPNVVGPDNFATDLTLPSGVKLSMANGAIFELDMCSSDPSSTGSMCVDGTSKEPEWKDDASTVHRLANYTKNTGRSGGQSIIGPTTTDGNDTSFVQMCGGGACGAGRGAGLLCYGNEAASNLTGGSCYLDLGSQSAAGFLEVRGGASTGTIFRAEYDGDVCLQKGGVTASACANDLGADGTAARDWGMERHTTSNTAGNALTLKAGGATSGATDKAGGTLKLDPGVSTGTGPAYVSVGGYTEPLSTGTSDNTRVDRVIVGPTKALTDNSAVDLVNVTAASNTAAMGTLQIGVEVFDGTDLDAASGSFDYRVVNKAGTITRDCSVFVFYTKSHGGTTLACTCALSNANPAVLSVTCNTSLTINTGEGDYMRATYTLTNYSQQAVSIVE